MTINAPAAMLLAFYVCVGEKQGVPPGLLRGTVQTDILKEYIAQKEWIFPPAPSMRLVVDMIEWCAREMPLMHPVSISGYHIREAGSTAAQELAFTLADGFAYVDACVARGLDVDEFAPRLSFFFNAHARLKQDATPSATSGARGERHPSSDENFAEHDPPGGEGRGAGLPLGFPAAPLRRQNELQRLPVDLGQAAAGTDRSR